MPTKKTLLPDPIFTLRNTAVTMMRTQYLSFELAMAFNNAYGLKLTRLDDIIINSLPHPCFIYYDEHTWLTYVVLAKPTHPDADTSFDNYDKMLLIRGRDAKAMQQRIYDDIHSRQYGIALGSAVEPDPNDLLKHDQWHHCNILADSVQLIDTFLFGPNDSVTSTLRLTPAEPTLFPLEAPAASSGENKAINNYHKQLGSFLENVFYALQGQLSDEEEEYL